MPSKRAAPQGRDLEEIVYWTQGADNKPTFTLGEIFVSGDGSASSTGTSLQATGNKMIKWNTEGLASDANDYDNKRGFEGLKYAGLG